MTSIPLILAYITSIMVHDRKKVPRLDRRDQKFADRIVTLIQQHEEEELEVTTETSLTSTDYDELDDDYDVESDMEQQEQEFNGIGAPKVVLFGKILVAIDRVWDAIRFYRLPGFNNNGSPKRRKPSCMFSKFKFLKNEKDLGKLVVYEKAGEIKPDRRSILAFISDQLYERTLTAINSGHILHDSVLRSMISEIISEFQIETTFYGSHGWLNNWKRAHRISSRSITTFTSRKRFTEKDKMAEKMNAFVKHAREEFQKYDPLRVYNMDQSGFQKELYTKRTLTNTGVQTVEVVTTGISHSYTVLPMIRLDGLLHPKLYVVFAEPTGEFPRNNPPVDTDNLVLRAAKGHIMGKDLMADFFDSVVFADDVEDDILCMGDSWPCWRRNDIIDSVRPPQKKIKLIIIPPGATGQIQPLDIGIFRTFKKFMKNLTEYAQRNHPEFLPHQRNSIILMLSQTYWMLGSPIFQEWRLYAWYAGGYVDSCPPRADKPTDFCFNRKVYGKCESPGCKRLSMIQCPFCSTNICFQEMIIEQHRCV
ncbi:hypothetical protein GCK72_002921 [Caenorhabditis remanei]|uniref:HTH CENPB-type domain-containing protein n=1 Tax=Caenorhabditis remanei TaxID=31234 RepID=A0A6A5HW66_CAERE|nr:hypothetical protein GCK72_002921 [Caenorhabditis remanei]KAF1771096.1 hypothetical protein GCK72_002921 [Caenorhabditis remanei]